MPKKALSRYLGNLNLPAAGRLIKGYGFKQGMKYWRYGFNTGPLDSFDSFMGHTKSDVQPFESPLGLISKWEKIISDPIPELTADPADWWKAPAVDLGWPEGVAPETNLETFDSFWKSTASPLDSVDSFNKATSGASYNIFGKPAEPADVTQEYQGFSTGYERAMKRSAVMETRRKTVGIAGTGLVLGGIYGGLGLGMHYTLKERARRRKKYFADRRAARRRNKPINKIVGHHPGRMNKQTEAAIDSDFSAGDSWKRQITKASKYMLASSRKNKILSKKFSRLINKASRLKTEDFAAAVGAHQFTKAERDVLIEELPESFAINLDKDPKFKNLSKSQIRQAERSFPALARAFTAGFSTGPVGLSPGMDYMYEKGLLTPNSIYYSPEGLSEVLGPAGLRTANLDKTIKSTILHEAFELETVKMFGAGKQFGTHYGRDLLFAESFFLGKTGQQNLYSIFKNARSMDALQNVMMPNPALKRVGNVFESIGLNKNYTKYYGMGATPGADYEQAYSRKVREGMLKKLGYGVSGATIAGAVMIDKDGSNNKPVNKITGHKPGRMNKITETVVGGDFVAGESWVPALRKGLISGVLATTLAATPATQALAKDVGMAAAKKISVTASMSALARHRAMTDIIDTVVAKSDIKRTPEYRERVSDMLYATGVHESEFFTKTRQWPTGPGRGYFSSEQITTADIVQRYAARSDKTHHMDLLMETSGKTRKELLGMKVESLDELVETTPVFATAVARGKYAMESDPMPETAEGRVAYWFDSYNQSPEAYREKRTNKFRKDQETWNATVNTELKAEKAALKARTSAEHTSTVGLVNGVLHENKIKHTIIDSREKVKGLFKVR